jgi:hypothetical protein
MQLHNRTVVGFATEMRKRSSHEKVGKAPVRTAAWAMSVEDLMGIDQRAFDR